MTVYAPGVAQLRLVGVHGANPWAVILHWSSGLGGAWSQNQINALAETAFTSWGTRIKALQTTGTILQFCDAVDLSSATLVFHRTTAAATPGSGAEPSIGLGVAVCISHRTNDRYRGGHGRSYFPSGPSTTSQDGDTLQAAVVTSWNTAFGQFVTDINTALNAQGLSGAFQCIPRYTYTVTNDDKKKKYVRERSAFLRANFITSSQTSNQLRSQRRRFGP